MYHNHHYLGSRASMCPELLAERAGCALYSASWIGQKDSILYDCLEGMRIVPLT